MNDQIYHLRHTQMEGKLQAQLSSIIYAYREHDDIPTREQLATDRVDNSYVSMVELCKDVGITYAPKSSTITII